MKVTLLDSARNSTQDRIYWGFISVQLLIKLDLYQKMGFWAHSAPVIAEEEEDGDSSIDDKYEG